MSNGLIGQLKTTLDAQLTRWEGDPPSGPMSIARSSFKSLAADLDRRERIGPSEKQMLAQGLKYMKTAESAEDKAFVAAVKKWKKAWNGRPLPNETLLGELLESNLRALAGGDAAAGIQLIDGGEASSLPSSAWNFYNVFEQHRGKGAIAVVSNKSDLSLYSDSGELLDRVYKALNKRLTKELGKPKGGSKSKEFASGRARLYASRQTTAGNDAFPFPKEQLRYSRSGGKLEILAARA